MDSVTYKAFGDELVKISSVGSTLKGWVSKGWKDLGRGVSGGSSTTGMGGWGGKVGTWREKLPVGGKSIATGFTAAAVPGMMSSQDPLGMERSRAERTSGYAGMALGSLAGTGAMLSAPGKAIPVLRSPLLRSIGGALVGGLVGEKLSTLPWQRSRQADQKAQQPPIQDPARRDALLQRAAAMQTLRQGN